MFEYNVHKSIEAKAIVGQYKQFAEIYKNNFSYPRFIGPCVALCRILKSTSYEDFAEKYFTYAEQNKNLPISLRGLTKDEFYDSAVRYKKLADIRVPNNNIPLETFFYDLTCHVFTETYDGHIEREVPLFNYLKNTLKLNVKFPETVDDDVKTGVDIFICDEKGIPIKGIQIKPSSFFIGFSKGVKKDIIEDNQSLVKKYFTAKKEYNIETYYCIYDDKFGWVFNNERNKLTFKLNHIYDINSYSENNYKKLVILTEGEYKSGTKKPLFFKNSSFLKKF